MRHRTAIASALVSAGLMLGTPIEAAERSETGLDGRQLEIVGFTGRLSVAPRPGRGIDLRLSGPEDQLARVRVEAAAGRVLVDAGDVTDGGGTTTVGQVKVIVSGGGKADVRIGGKGTELSEGMTLEVALPPGTALAVRGITGEAEIGDIAAPLELDVTTANVQAGRVGPAQLQLSGSGEIAVAEVRERLEVGMTGAGSIRVESGNVEELVAEMVGSGELAFGGRAEQARLKLTGAATAEIAHVEARPEVVTTGAAEARIGNWR